MTDKRISYEDIKASQKEVKESLNEWKTKTQKEIDKFFRRVLFFGIIVIFLVFYLFTDLKKELEPIFGSTPPVEVNIQQEPIIQERKNLFTEGRSGHFNINLSTWSRKDDVVYTGHIPLENIEDIKFSMPGQLGAANPVVATYIKNGEIFHVSCNGHYY